MKFEWFGKKDRENGSGVESPFFSGEKKKKGDVSISDSFEDEYRSFAGNDRFFSEMPKEARDKLMVFVTAAFAGGGTAMLGVVVKRLMAIEMEDRSGEAREVHQKIHKVVEELIAQLEVCTEHLEAAKSRHLKEEDNDE